MAARNCCSPLVRSSRVAESETDRDTGGALEPTASDDADELLDMEPNENPDRGCAD